MTSTSPRRARRAPHLLAAAIAATATLAALPLDAPGSHAVAAEPPVDPVVTVLGPDQVTLLDALQLFVDTSALPSSPAPDVSWDLDDDGTFETADDGTRSVRLAVDTLGPHRYAVRVSAGGRDYVDDLVVTATRPATSRLALSPALPRRGQKLTLATSARSASPVATTWDLEGIKPSRTRAPLGRGAVAAGTTRTHPRAGTGLATPETVIPVLSVVGTGQGVTPGASLAAAIPGGGGFEDRNLTLSASSLFPDGTKLTTVRAVQVTDSKADGYATKTIPPNTVFDCDALPTNGPAAPCASLTYSTPRATFPTLFDDTTPSVQWCHPLGQNATASNTVVSEEAADIAGSPSSFWGGLTAPRSGSSRPEPQVRTERRGEQVCLTAAPQTVSWDFGDQSGVQFPTSSAPVPHVFSAPGTYPVTLTTKVPYLKDAHGDLSDSPRWMTVKRVAKVVVTQKELCGFAGFGGLRAYTMPSGLDPQLVAASTFADTSCWDVLRADDGHSYLRTRPGWVVWLVSSTPTSPANEKYEQVRVQGSVAGGLRQLLVDPKTGTLTPLKGTVDARWSLPGQDPVRVLSTPVLHVPAPDGSGIRAFPTLPTPNGVSTLNGLRTTSAQLVMRNSGLSYVKHTLAMPPPLTGETPVAYRIQDPTALPGGLGRAALAYPPGVDFRVDVTGMSMAGIGVKQGYLEHYTDGDVWRASLVVDVLGYGLNAPFLPDSGATQPERCDQVAGPSGLQISNGSFDFGGASLTANPGIPVGPLAINCVAFNMRTQPYILRGAAAGSILNSPIGFNACFAYGVLDKGDKGNQCGGSYVAEQDGVSWMRASGIIKLLGDYFTLHGAAEGAFGGGAAQISVEGGVHWEYLSDPIDVVVDFGLKGGVRFNTGEFSLFGHVSGCVNPAYIPTICGSAQGGITSRGGGVCIGPAGAVYQVVGGFDWFLISCDLQRDIGIAGLRTTKRAASNGLTLAPGLAKATFVATTDERNASPDVTLVSPSGKRIVAGEPFGDRTATVAHNPERGETYIALTKPEAGRWKILLNDGSARLSAVDLYTPAGAPKVTGAVAGRGQTRTLDFGQKHLTAEDRITFVEKSDEGERVLGVRGRNGSDITIPASGLPGPRKVFAVVERRGIPFERVLVDSYDAPGVPDLAAPRSVTVKPAGSDLRTQWEPVPGAAGYQVTLRLADGRTLRTYTERTSTTFPEVTRYSGGTVKVVAQDGTARDSAPGTRALEPLTTVELHL